MDPKDPASFSHRKEYLSTGRSYHFIDQLPKNYHSSTTPTILCVHGFPDLWYGWRYQIGPWTRKGYRVVVPDMLGYGGTDQPLHAVEYSTRRLCDDLAALLDLLEVKKAVIIGHDWGSYTVGRFALWHPDRLLALIMLSVPFTPPSPEYISVRDVARRVPNLGYQVYLADQQSTGEIEQNLDVFLRVVFSAPKHGTHFTRQGELQNLVLGQTRPDPGTKSILNDVELQYYRLNFQGNMNGPLSYYRTAKPRYEEEKVAGLQTTPRSDLPVLYLWGTEDPTHTPVQMQRARKWIPRLQDIALEGRGHWVMVEAKEDVTEKILEWLDGLLPPSGNKSKL